MPLSLGAPAETHIPASPQPPPDGWTLSEAAAALLPDEWAAASFPDDDAAARERLADGQALDAVAAAAQAVTLEASVESRSVLLEGLLAVSPSLDRSLRIADFQPEVLAWSADSTALAIGGPGRMLVWTPFDAGAAAAITDMSLEEQPGLASMRPAVRALAWRDGQLWAAMEDGRLLGRDRSGHHPSSTALIPTDQVKLAVIGGNGMIVAAAFSDPDVSAFRCPDAAAGCVRVTIGSGYAAALALDRSDRLAAMGSADGTTRIVRIDGEQTSQIATVQAGGPVRALAWSADAAHLAIGTASGQLAIVNASGRRDAEIRAGSAAVPVIAWNPRDGRIAAPCAAQAICVWAMEHNDQAGFALRRVARLTGIVEDASALAWSPDGQVLASAAGDTVRLWAVDRHDSATFTLDTGGGAALSDTGVSADGAALAATDDHGDVHRWGLPSFTPQPRLAGNGLGTVRVLAWSPRAPVLAAADGEQHVAIIAVPRREKAGLLTVHGDDIQAMRWMPDGVSILTGGSLDGTIGLTPAAGGATQIFGALHGDAVAALAVSPDGARVVSADTLGKVILWNTATRVGETPIATGAGRGTAAFSQDGRHFLVAGNDGNVLIFVTDQPARVPQRCNSGSTMIDDAVFTSDGDAVVAVTGNRTPRITIWTLGDGCALRATAPLLRESAAAAGPDAAPGPGSRRR